MFPADWFMAKAIWYCIGPLVVLAVLLSVVFRAKNDSGPEDYGSNTSVGPLSDDEAARFAFMAGTDREYSDPHGLGE